VGVGCFVCGCVCFLCFVGVFWGCVGGGLVGVFGGGGGGGGGCMCLSGWAEMFVCVYECVRAFKY